MTTVHFEPFDLSQHLDIVVDFHKEHVAINFPESIYRASEFSSVISAAVRDSDHMVVATESSEVVGFVWLRVVDDPYRECRRGEVKYVHVAPRRRGGGIGRQMMGYIETYFAEQGVLYIRLGTHVQNLAARKLYKSSGYVPTRIVMEKML